MTLPTKESMSPSLSLVRSMAAFSARPLMTLILAHPLSSEPYVTFPRTVPVIVPPDSMFRVAPFTCPPSNTPPAETVVVVLLYRAKFFATPSEYENAPYSFVPVTSASFPLLISILIVVPDSCVKPVTVPPE